MDTKEIIRAFSFETGFDVVGFTSPDLPSAISDGLYRFLGKEHHGDMAWMHANSDRRVNPKAIWQGVKSVIVLGQNYAPDENPLHKILQNDIGNISCYAQGNDYHDVIKKKLKALARLIGEKFSCDARVFVDTAPVMEKPLAQRAGLGWQGKHTCLVSREFGSWLFLGEIFVSLALPPDEPHDNYCGNCTRCMDICPTQAFIRPHEIDARKCISYLTIEHKGHIAKHFREAIGNRIYGCDDCLAVCPWNKFASQSKETAYHARAELKSPTLTQLITLNDADFRALFSKSPVKRIGRDRFIRNVLIAAGNSKNSLLIPHIENLLEDASVLVRAMAVWALTQLAQEAEYAILKTHYLAREHDLHVAAEWKKEEHHA